MYAALQLETMIKLNCHDTCSYNTITTNTVYNPVITLPNEVVIILIQRNQIVYAVPYKHAKLKIRANFSRMQVCIYLFKYTITSTITDKE